jgi:hypothetical protein
VFVHSRTKRAARIVMALIPPAMLTFAVPFVNRDETLVLGFPLVLVWIALWVALTPLFLYAVDRLRECP